MQRGIVWKGINTDTDEVCCVNFHANGISIRSEIKGWAEGMPVSVEYFIRLNKKWNVLEFDIQAQTGLSTATYKMKLEEGAWRDAKGVRNEFNDCKFIDITFTPFTNSLPINSLQLPVGETAEIKVVYIDILEKEMREDTQWYTRLSERVYNFKNAFGFSADIDVDGQGFVTAYPQLFKMI